jgi:hypothetical protein
VEILFICKSYLTNPEVIISGLDDINNKWEDYFIEIKQKDKITHMVNRFDLNYLAGAIYLKYGDEVIFDFKLWDYVDQLWAYIINLVEDFILKGSAETFFPDQPVKMVLKVMSDDYVLFILESSTKHTWAVPKQQFLSTLLDSSEYFFGKLTEYLGLGDNQYCNELNKIKELKRKIYS